MLPFPIVQKSWELAALMLTFLSQNEAIVEVQQGKLRGIVEHSLSGKEYSSFLGIPYAKPPIGELRFKPPEPVDSWSDIKNARHDGSHCWQQNIFIPTIFYGSEDCLYLNVYVPEKPRNDTNKAVMFFIHGGGFSFGSGSSQIYSPDYLIEHDVIVVTINYRLNVLGFLNLELPEANGNYGLKDQLMALKWVKENIKQFGGNPDAITIFGESAGASAVHLHTISPASKGLFNKAILESGTSLSPWSYTESHIETAFKLGKLLGFNGNNAHELLTFLKEQDARQLAIGNKMIMDAYSNEMPGCDRHVYFVPSVEKYREGAFLPESPIELLKKASPVPVIAGYNSKEGILALSLVPLDTFTKIQNDNSNLVKHNIKEANDNNLLNVTEKIKRFYFGENEIGIGTLSAFCDVYTDLLFRHFYQSFDHIIKSTQPVYMYEFSYDGKLNRLKNLVKFKVPFEIKGAAHADELGYLFRQRILPFEFIDPKDRNVIHHMTKLWTNFAKTGSPNDESEGTEWIPTTPDKPCYLEINENLTLVNGKINEKRVKFWEELTEYMNST